ncbi:hypothetical protein QJQ45_000360 [Haematococcus lacustris]|nr:hypothetical protein QJQ45_000360 [Haematococcus lacustris]
MEAAPLPLLLLGLLLLLLLLLLEAEGQARVPLLVLGPCAAASLALINTSLEFLSRPRQAQCLLPRPAFALAPLITAQRLHLVTSLEDPGLARALPAPLLHALHPTLATQPAPTAQPPSLPAAPLATTPPLPPPVHTPPPAPHPPLTLLPPAALPLPSSHGAACVIILPAAGALLPQAAAPHQATPQTPTAMSFHGQQHMSHPPAPSPPSHCHTLERDGVRM